MGRELRTKEVDQFRVHELKVVRDPQDGQVFAGQFLRDQGL